MLIHKNLRVLNFKKIKNHYQKNIKTYSKGSSRTGESKLNLLSSILIEKGGCVDVDDFSLIRYT